MKNEDIINKLALIHNLPGSLDNFLEELQLLKEDYVKLGDQEQAKNMWIFQTIVEIHRSYRTAFKLLQNRSYYDGWCDLEKIEIIISSLKHHFAYNRIKFHLWHIEKSVANLQAIFPYRIFASSELLKKEKKCGICDKIVSIRNPCGHIVGEIYDGEMCCQIVTSCEVLSISLVEVPNNKYAVSFLKDKESGEQIDHYNYKALDYLFNLIDSPYEPWDLKVSERIITQNHYGTVERNEICPCGSGMKFKKCCRKNIGNKYTHFEFIVSKLDRARILSNPKLIGNNLQ
jgi:hypothetical protein